MKDVVNESLVSTYALIYSLRKILGRFTDDGHEKLRSPETGIEVPTSCLTCIHVSIIPLRGRSTTLTYTVRVPLAFPVRCCVSHLAIAWDTFSTCFRLFIVGQHLCIFISAWLCVNMPSCVRVCAAMPVWHVYVSVCVCVFGPPAVCMPVQLLSHWVCSQIILH